MCVMKKIIVISLFALLMAVVLLALKYFNRNLEDGVGWGTLLLVFVCGTILMVILGRTVGKAEVVADNTKQEE